MNKESSILALCLQLPAKTTKRLSARFDSLLDLRIAWEGTNLAEVFVPLVTSHRADFNNMGPLEISQVSP